MSLFKRRYYLSSRDKVLSTSSTNYFDINLTLNIDRKFTQASVRKITIPYSVYTINSNNNKLYWVDSDSKTKTSTITSGNYDETTLAAAITTQMNADKTSADTYTCTVSTATAKITITNNTNNFQLTCTNNSQAIWDTLGYSILSNKTGATTYTGTNVYNLQPTTMIYICSSISGGNDSRVPSGDFPIIGSVPVSANFGDIITYISDTDDTINISNTSSTLHFEVRDDQLRLLDLNGLNWSLEIDFY